MKDLSPFLARFGLLALLVAATTGAFAQTLASSAINTAPNSLPALAMEDQLRLDGLIQDWPNGVVNLPAKLPLESELQTTAQAFSAELRPLLVAAAQKWLLEIRSSDTTLSGPLLLRHLMARMNNELVSWMVASPGAALEAVEWRLAQQPRYCRERPSIHEDQWSLLAERLLFLQPLQGREREVALAAERQRWQQWLAGDLPTQSTPAPAPQLQAFQAAQRQRAGDAVGPHAMTPWLSRQVLGEHAASPYSGLMLECALLQWWLINEVQRQSLSPQEAMRLFRFGTLPKGEDLLLMPAQTRQAARSADVDSYPPIAQYFELSGTTQVAVILDAAGAVRDVQILGRKLQMPGLAAGQVPVAFEQILDRAGYARLRAMRFDKPDAGALRNGVVRVESELVWRLE